jgi:hypothetical protein
MSFDKRFIFPSVLLAMNLASAAMSLWGGDWKRGLYWLASAVCIATVAFSE